MRRFFTIICFLGFFFTANKIFSAPLYSASVQVYNWNGQPLAGVAIRMEVSTSSYFDVSFGTTNANGFVYLYLTAPGILEYMSVQIWGGDYVILSSQNTRTTTSNTLYPVFNLILDTDGDFVDDNFESQLAEKFSPVLHKHSWEKQQDLSSVDWILTGKATLKGYNILGQEVHSSALSDPSQIHIYQQWHRDSFGSGDYWTFWQLDIDDSYRYQGAPVGQRPVYYHVYKEGNYYYVQYWFFFNMNDLAGQSNNNTWHEADFEHVSIKVNSAYTPVAVNFYRHEGGRTFAASDCWWSSSDSPTYSGIAQGYSSSLTHLHIWTAANAHASYNRYSKVWRVIASGAIVNPCLTIANEDYTDNVDYDPSSSDLYFENDYLEKLGEFRESPLHQASNGQYYPYAHNYHWLDHNEPVNNSKPWLGFVLLVDLVVITGLRPVF